MVKRLIVCCDGTWNTADQAISGHPSPTNVTKLALSIAPEDAAGPARSWALAIVQLGSFHA